MHSVVVIGDVRTHRIPLATKTPVYGGALMTTEAIRAAIGTKQLKSQRISLFGYAPPKDSETVGDVHEWAAEWNPLSGSQKLHYRLKPAETVESTATLPTITAELMKIIQEGRAFEARLSSRQRTSVRAQMQVSKCPDVVVFQDLNLERGFRQLSLDGHIDKSDPQSELRSVIAELFVRFQFANSQAAKLQLPLMEPVIICAVKGNPSSIRLKRSDRKKPSTPWEHLFENTFLRERSIILLDAAELRGKERPLAISTGLSWERTAQDTIFELLRDQSFRPFMDFGQIVIRYGVTGALHIVKRAKGDWSYTLHFDPAQHDKAWTSEIDGVVLGNTSVFIASMVKALNDTCRKQNEHPLLGGLESTISEAINDALRGCRQLSELSYGSKDGEKNEVSFDTAKLMGGVFKKRDIDSPTGANDERTPLFQIVETSVPPVNLRNWSILSQSCQFCIGRVARQIVKQGVDSVLNNPDYEERIPASVVRFGKLDAKSGKDDRMVIVDRREIEGCRAIQKLMVAHVADVRGKTNRRPLAFAVFGPPGSGKSTAVEKIIESLDDGATKFKKLPAYNLSQFSNVDELDSAFADIVNASADDQIPVAFFDEFDSPFGGAFGWLKLFLAPMEDGAFRKKSAKNAILVFAGGTSPTFSDFSMESRARTDDQWVEFSKAKGPDFVSRLRGHLNVVGINPADTDDELYMIRRAILIRALISRIQGLKENQDAEIDAGMIRALLHVPEYRHGGRAVRMLLDLCQSDDHRVSVSSVPPIHQLNMLVDGKAFQDLLNNTFADD